MGKALSSDVDVSYPAKTQAHRRTLILPWEDLCIVHCPQKKVRDTTVGVRVSYILYSKLDELI